jgi:hypothetical protein
VPGVRGRAPSNDFFAGVAGTVARAGFTTVFRSLDSEDKAALNFFAVEPSTLDFIAEGISVLGAEESGRLGVKGTDRVSLLGAGIEAIVSVCLGVVIV